MTEPQPPRIEFPCRYPIKVVGEAAADFRAMVVEVMENHAGPLAAEDIKVRDSRHGRFSSVTVTIVATGEAQLQRIFTELKATGRVHMVL